MTSEATIPKDSSKDKGAIEVKNKYLEEIQKDTEELKNGLEKKGKFILELELEKQLAESKLSGLQNLLDSKLKEYVDLDVSKKTEIKNESESKDKLKAARVKRMASILEYKNKMAKLREQVFSPLDLNDAKINEEIEYLMAFYEDLNEKNKMLQYEIDYLMKRTVPETEANDAIDKMQLLMKQLKLETVNDQKLREELQIELKLLDKQIQENIETN